MELESISFLQRDKRLAHFSELRIVYKNDGSSCDIYNAHH